MKKKLILAILIFCLIMSNYTTAQVLEDGYYYSPKLKKGKILKWENTGQPVMWQPEINLLINEQVATSPYLTKIKIIQDIPDEPLDGSPFAGEITDYFKIDIGGSELPDYDVEETLGYYIIPYLFVKYGNSSSIYDFYSERIDNPLFNESYLEHKNGNTIFNYTIFWEAEPSEYDWSFEIIVNDETGIVKKYSSYTFGKLFEHNYIGGINLTNYEFTTFIFVIIGIPILYVLRKKKRKI
jgi:hypothetical protein